MGCDSLEATEINEKITLDETTARCTGAQKTRDDTQGDNRQATTLKHPPRALQASEQCNAIVERRKEEKERKKSNTEKAGPRSPRGREGECQRDRYIDRPTVD